MDAIWVIQQRHLGSDKEWESIQLHLDRTGTICKAQDILRAERTWGHCSFFGDCNEIIWKKMSTMFLFEYEKLFTFEPSLFRRCFSGDLVDACLLHEWEKFMRESQEYIERIAEAVSPPAGQPGNHGELPPAGIPWNRERDIPIYRWYKRMFMSDFTFQTEDYTRLMVGIRSFRQAVALTHDAISLERYYLAHGAYPARKIEAELLFLESGRMIPGDWKYERHDGESFTLQIENEDGDDLVWKIDGRLPAVPEERRA